MDEHDNFYFNFHLYPPGLKQSINYKESSWLFFSRALEVYHFNVKESLGVGGLRNRFS